jgi:hypothetical protein
MNRKIILGLSGVPEKELQVLKKTHLNPNKITLQTAILNSKARTFHYVMQYSAHVTQHYDAV